jgi:hypothetical protein
MNATERKDFCQIVLGLAELYGKELSSPALALYWNSLRDWPLDEFRTAAELLLRRCEFMPAPRDFEVLRRAARPLAGEAWSRVLAHLRGGYRSGVGVDDGGPIDQAVLSIGGYQVLAHRDMQYLGIDERRFTDRFAQVVDAIDVRRALPRFTDANCQATSGGRLLADVEKPS